MPEDFGTFGSLADHFTKSASPRCMPLKGDWSMKCKSRSFYSIWLLLFFWYILEGIALFLFAWGFPPFHPAIQISGINATPSEQSHFIDYLFLSMACLVITTAIAVLFCDPPKNKVKKPKNNGHDNECMRGTDSVRNINRHEEHTKEKPDG